ncbi:MAG: ferritin family protein [Thermodesulfobacteriota bacterium]
MDPVHFTGKEVLDMAVRIEENGVRFYTDAARASSSNAIKALFDVLAEEEGHHIKVFLDLKRTLPEDENSSEGFDPYWDEASQYLKALADTEVFTTPEDGGKLAGKMHNEREVVEVAIGMEKDSLLFYYEMEKMIREKDRHILESLIEQEKDHLKKLTELLGAITG